MLDVPLARRLGRPWPASPEQITATAESLAAPGLNGPLGRAPPPSPDGAGACTPGRSTW
ncbi:hypothetical protein [Streptomyces adelaidensis]|uniref:hypothetical protein n=1 Tax=Streptomyces adelaidensis TaxID=2796465 RepID=UPI001F2FC48B|nr:hypothetical protein [Streptomyces adelaidensis]